MNKYQMIDVEQLQDLINELKDNDYENKLKYIIEDLQSLIK